MPSKTSDNKIANASSLYVNKQCAWPNCTKSNKNLAYETLESYRRDHLNLMHRLNDHSQKDLLSQINKVTHLELELQQNRALLSEMLTHLNNKLVQESIVGLNLNQNVIQCENVISENLVLAKSDVGQNKSASNKENLTSRDENAAAESSNNENRQAREVKNRSGSVLNEG
jgi:hypothetical protein